MQPQCRSRAGAGRGPVLRHAFAAGMLAVCFGLSPLSQAAQADSIGDFQKIVDDYLAERGDAESISGLAAYVSLGDPGPGLEFFAGQTAKTDGVPMSGETLFEIGSNTKGFTGALILALEAEGKLDIDQTVGDWLPLYPAWKDVSIRDLLNMVSGIPTYSESMVLSRLWVTDPERHYTLEDLIDYAYPSATVDLPPTKGYFYSNTNYVLAGMIAEKASGMPYKQLLEEKLFRRAGLNDIYYEPVELPADVLDRMASGYFDNPECGLYEPDCTEAVLAPMIGRDVRTDDLSWAGPAGGIVSTPRELVRWIRAVFAGKVLPQEQLEELMSLVSTRTGKPIDEVTADDPRGFGLGLVQLFRPELGKLWFYEGETLGYRMAFFYSPEADIVIAVAANSQPDGKEDQIGPLLAKLFDVAKQAKSANGG